MKVKITLTLDVDTDAYAYEYGLGADEVREDVQRYILSHIQDSFPATEGLIKVSKFA